jgi:HK97 gp10 family phage protein
MGRWRGAYQRKARRAQRGPSVISAEKGGISFSFYGEDDIRNALERMIADISADALEEAGLTGAQVLVDDMQERVAQHKRTGRLARGIGMMVTEKTRYHVIVLVGLTKSAFYGRFLETGTSKMDAMPFARPSWDENENEVNGAILGKLREVVMR